ncbi:uncharacterized protein LOC120537073 isoform X3 [Polypterus senegalus]|uniref:uncharacterized protein LOC120537073 isoform X3 n=1 Tax=Polypterus senegalus TaxID=55291 RepID=UPI001964A739|nr:uncharacterized protein LOC120537073 isoform X3 [Polypterus senegalus]
MKQAEHSSSFEQHPATSYCFVIHIIAVGVTFQDSLQGAWRGIPVAGLVLGGLGIWLRLSSLTRGLFDVNLDTKQFVIAIILLIAVGLTLLCFSISSLCGACAESLEGIYVIAENLGEFYAVVYLKYLNTRDPSLAITLKLFHYKACPQLIPQKISSSGGTILCIFIAVAAFMVMTAIFNGILLTAIKKNKNQVSQEALPLHMQMNNF